MPLVQVERNLWLPDRSLKFGGATSDRIDCGAGSSLENWTTQTIMAWISYANFSQTNVRIFQKGLSPNQQLLGMATANSPRCNLGRGTGQSGTGAEAECAISKVPVIQLNKWFFWAGTN